MLRFDGAMTAGNITDPEIGDQRAVAIQQTSNPDVSQIREHEFSCFGGAESHESNEIALF